MLVAVCHFCTVPTSPLRVSIAFWPVHTWLVVAITLPAFKSTTVIFTDVVTVVQEPFTTTALKDFVSVKLFTV